MSILCSNTLMLVKLTSMTVGSESKSVFTEQNNGKGLEFGSICFTTGSNKC